MLGIDRRADLGRNDNMKKLIWFAVLLAGCRQHHWNTFDGTELRVPVHRVDLDVPPAADTATLPSAVVAESPGGVTKPVVPDRGGAVSTVNGALEDVYFGYDRFDLSTEALDALRRDASLLCAILAEFPGLRVVIEGHCDERGSAEYNLGLGDRRARRAEAVLKEFGVPADVADVISYGKETPVCTEAREECWQKNRRAHIQVK